MAEHKQKNTCLRDQTAKHINYLGLVSIIVKAKWIAIKYSVVGFR